MTSDYTEFGATYDDALSILARASRVFWNCQVEECGDNGASDGVYPPHSCPTCGGDLFYEADEELNG